MLDGVRWASLQHYQILDTRFCIRSTSTELGELLHHLFVTFEDAGPCRSELDHVLSLVERADSAGDFDGVRHNPELGERVIFEQMSVDRVVMRLVVRLNTGPIRVTSSLAIHSGVIGHGGRIIALPGSSGSGKSTLVTACLAEGFSYGSDEALCIDPPSLAVRPYPKPIWLSSVSRKLVGLQNEHLSFRSDRYDTAIVTVGDLGAEVVEGPGRLTDVVLLDRDGGGPTLERLPPAVTASTLLKHAFDHGPDPRATFRAVTALAKEGRAWRLRFREPVPAAQCLKAGLAETID